MSCPACGKLNTPETGVAFPTDSARFVRFCLQLQIQPKNANKKALICFEHFDPKHLVKKNGKITGITRIGIPLKISKKQPTPAAQPVNQKKQQEKNKDMNAKGGQTLDQLLAQNVGFGVSNVAGTSSRSANTNVAPGSSANIQPIGIFGHPRTPQTNMMAASGSGVRSTNSIALSELANRTIVLCRQKKPGASSPTMSAAYFQEWLIHSFNLPAVAIREQSQVFHVANYCLNFLLLDEKRTIETILTMYRSTSPNTYQYQCMLDSAANILMEGAHPLRKQQKGGGKNANQTKEMSLDECFRLLLPSTENNPPTSSAAVDTSMNMEVDDNAWNNIAAAMMPVYRNLVMANSFQAQQSNANTSNLPIPSSVTSTLMNPTSTANTSSHSNVPLFSNLAQQNDRQKNRPPHRNRR